MQVSKTDEAVKYFAAAWHKYAEYKFKEAICLYDKGLTLNENYWGGWYNSAKCKYELGEFIESLEYFNKADEVNPNSYVIYSGRGFTKISLGYLEEALLDQNKIIELKPERYGHDSFVYHIYYNDRGDTYSLLEKYSEAIQDYKKAIELRANYYTAHFNIGNNYLFIQQYSEAENHFNRALQLWCECPQAIQGKGFILYFKYNQIAEGENHLDKAEHLFKTIPPRYDSLITNAHVQFYYNRAKVFYIHSEFALSYQSIQKGLQIKPDYHLLQLQKKVLQKLIPIHLSTITSLQAVDLKYLLSLKRC